MKENRFSGFILRNAAGMWHILDVTNSEVPYKAPLRINETGAKIWEMLQNGLSEDEIAKKFVDEFGINQKEASDDVKAFIAQLVSFGVPVN